MDKQTKTKIKNMVLSLREDFEKEITNRLNNMGISPEREWKDGRSLPHLSEDELGRNELEKRRRVAAFISREIKVGQSQKAATEEFIREASYTWINRLIGLKCLESQGLIEEVITSRPEYGNRSKQHRNFREENPVLAAKSDDGLIGCLFSAFESITEEIQVLFDPKDEYSLIVPRYPVLKNSIEKINTELDYETYQADDFLGWIYQYFNSKEKDRVFEEVKTKKKKIAGNDIVNATQLYTEKYMVHFLVENSLGAMWMEMYPDSSLSSRWEYFVKDPNNSTREPKPVKEIKFLDPAGGSGHFLLYAFDLFYTMYEEEGIIPRDQIPEFILRNNLYGIDIDQRAIQLSALGLYMKAKTKNPCMKVLQMNLVSANAVMLNSDILEEFLQEFKDDKVAQELIKTIWIGLANVRELGSLLKIEENIDEVIKRQKKKGENLDFSVKGQGRNWTQWKHDLLKSIKKYYQKATDSFDLNKQLFANEAYKGVQFLDLLEQRYDIVATNPPYMGNKTMGNNLKQYLQTFYSNNNNDLYQAFIGRCIELNKSNGYISMICQKSFLFLNSFVSTRNLILNTGKIKTLALLGSGAFEDIDGEKVNTAMFSFKNYKINNYYSIFIDVSNEINKGSKIKENLLRDNIYGVDQNDFQLIEDNPFVFWVKEIDKIIFESYKHLDDKTKNSYATPKQGLITGNNDKFLRYFWETNNCINWKPYMKGGEPNKWYGNQEYVVNWFRDGEAIKTYFDENGKLLSRPQNVSFYFKEGVTYSTTSSKFAARYMPEGFIFDAKASGVFPLRFANVYYLLGFFNSKVSINMLNLLSPSLDFNVGYTQKIPFKVPKKEIEGKVTKYTKACIDIKQILIQFEIDVREFKQPAIQFGYNKLTEK